MTDEQSHAHQDAEKAARSGATELLEQVAGKIGLHAGAQAVFGEPVEREGVTVIPVAQVIIGTGAGAGSSPGTADGDDAGAGAGAGGAAVTRPLGYIEIDEDGAVFQSIRQWWENAGLIVSIAFAVLLLAKALRTLLRG